MPTLRVMSWNVESFGMTKAIAGANAAGQGEIVNFIANAIVTVGASIVGIMEVKSGYGATLAGWLTGSLNNLQPPPGQWEAAVSPRQDGGPYEEYLMLWRVQPG